MNETKVVYIDLTVTEAQLKHVLSHLKMIKIPYHIRETEDDE